MTEHAGYAANGHLGQQLALDGIARAEAGADPRWFAEAVRQVRWLATVRYKFTTDDVWALLHDSGVGTREPRAMGAVMRAAAAGGYVEATGEYVPSQRPECHARPVRVWRAG